MRIFVFPSGPFQTNAMVLAEGKAAVVIDPAPGSKEALLACIEREGLLPEAIWLTHSHYDHIGDLAALKEELGIPVGVHERDRANVEAPGSDGLPGGVLPTKVDFTFGKTVSFGPHTAEVIETPGHTPGGVCFYFADEGILIAGDTLFDGTIGRLDLPTGEPDKMWPSLAKLAALPKETRFYPGHGPDATIGEQTWLSNAQQLFGGNS